MKMRDWAKQKIGLINFMVVPDARARLIHHQYQSDNDQRRQAAAYFVNVYPSASWEQLAGWIYQEEEKEAAEVFKAHLPKPKGNQCDCVECVGAVCSDSVHSAL